MNVKDLSILLSVIKRFKIKDKSGKAVFFKPNRIQIKIIKYIFECWNLGIPAKMIIIKGRQQGVTTLFQLIALAMCLKVPGFQAYIMAHDRGVANDLFENKIKFAWDKFPEGFKQIYEVNKNNVRQLLFDGAMDKSSITVGLSGRGGTYQFILISEPGKMSLKKSTYNEMIEGTLPAGEFASIIAFESTADGGMGQFFKLVQENLKPNSQYKVMFLVWTDTDEYQANLPTDETWKVQYSQFAKDYKLCVDPVKEHNISENQFYWYFLQVKNLGDQVKTQYPFTLKEAFASMSGMYFEESLIKQALKRIEFNESKGITYHEDNNFKIWVKPVPGHKYAIGIDCSTGEAGDNSAISVFDAQTGEQVAEAIGKYDETTTALMGMQAGFYYNGATVGIEINNMGRGVLREFIRLEYPEELIYKRLVPDITNPRNARLPKLGWETNLATRPLLLSEYKGVFKEQIIKINSKVLLGEKQVFINIKGKFEAAPTFHDDALFAAMIAYQVILFIKEKA